MEFKFDPEINDKYLDCEEGTIRIVQENDITVVIFIEKRTSNAYVINIIKEGD
ncbi:hypothetical protein Riggi_74 [Bacillus phage Riggi]|uniref:Uncharacterized protein n=1 Tax=Bacillus phage Riggi TaxID=2884426 RepID=U5PWU4_9CAUD|nr:hypothetical protein Riggi_74 [Bacillus phage Riggi]AGY48236.1 hypothetical protein Riggi_74 [Bacillus phage Riggi]